MWGVSCITEELLYREEELCSIKCWVTVVSRFKYGQTWLKQHWFM
jgi:hypothetical protein